MRRTLREIIDILETDPGARTVWLTSDYCGRELLDDLNELDDQMTLDRLARGNAVE